MTQGTAPRFSLGTFSIAGGPPFPGVVMDEKVTALSALAAHGAGVCGVGSVLDLLQSWQDNFTALQKFLSRCGRGGLADVVPEGAVVPLAALTLHAPVNLPRQVFCAGANYRKHVIELRTDWKEAGGTDLSPEERRAKATAFMDERAASGTPFVFSKLPSAIVGANDPILLPPGVDRPDWELELGVIIGRTARNVSRDEALSLVAGYTIANDITARDYVMRKDTGNLGADWLVGKGLPSFLPLGPTLLPAAFVNDPQDLQITLKLNGDVMQDESTADMLYTVARLLEYLSKHVTLWPGDLLLTGSPAGNGTHYNRFLRPGDVMESSITGMGVQRNICVAA